MKVFLKTLVCFSLVLASFKLYSIDLCGSISGSITAAGSPYVVTCDLTVDPGNTLAIEDGVELRFLNGSSLVVYGSLNVNGTSTNQVIFTSATANPTTPDWGGIYVEGTATIRYAAIKYASYGVRCVDFANSSIYSSLFESDDYGICAYGTGVSGGTIADCIFSNNNIPILLDSIYPAISGITVNENNSVCNGIIIGGTFSSNITIVNVGCPYVFSGVSCTSVLTIKEGVIAKFDNGAVNNISSLICSGTTAHSVILTSLKDDYSGGDTNADGPSVGGAYDWPGISVSSGYVSLSNAVIKYAVTGLSFTASELNYINVIDSYFSFNEVGMQIGALGISTPGMISGTTFSNNQLEGIFFQSGVKSEFIVTGCYFDHNSSPISMEGDCYPSFSYLSVAENHWDWNGILLSYYSSSGTLKNAGCPYIGGGWGDETTLTLEKGTIIKIGSSVEMWNLIINGTSDEPVVITSIYDDTYGGDTNGDGWFPGGANLWSGLNIRNMANINNAIIRCSHNGLVTADTASGIIVSVANTTFSNNGTGMSIIGTSGSPQGSVNECRFINNSGPGIYFQGGISSIFSVSNSVFDQNECPIRIANNSYPSLSGLTVNENHLYYNGIILEGTYNQNGTFTNAGCPYIIEPGFSLGSGITLTLHKGTIIKCGHAAGIAVFNIKIIGTVNEPVIFTSLSDDDYGGDTNNNGTSSGTVGDWSGVTISAGLTSLSNLGVYYGDYGLRYNGSRASIYDTEIKNCNVGISFDNYSQGYLNNSDIICNGTGVYVDPTSVAYLGRVQDESGYNQFVCNNLHLVNENAVSVIAENDWWGNIPPNGDKFTGLVDYDPYLPSGLGGLLGALKLSLLSYSDVHLLWNDFVLGCGYRVYRSQRPDQDYEDISGYLSNDEFTDIGAGNQPGIYYYKVELE